MEREYKTDVYIFTPDKIVKADIVFQRTDAQTFAYKIEPLRRCDNLLVVKQLAVQYTPTLENISEN